MAYLDNNGLAYFWSKVKNYIDSRPSGGGHTAKSVTLSASGWSLSGGYYYQTASVSGVTASSDLIVDTDNSSIKCTAQAAGSLTFRAINPTAATVKVMIFQ